ncbi:MAG: FtsW/RodA/SpoVE family cell cycle protein [Clostridia bacterium]|nr:FtsW/RodA/SpoVE family cell cycle protein [Clostridia bacterium]
MSKVSRVLNKTGERISRLFAPLDKPTLILTSLLSLVSLVTLLGAYEYTGKTRMLMQLAMTIAGFALMLVLAHLDFHALIENGFWWLLIFSVGFLALTLLIGTAQNGETNKSWIMIPKIGFTIQPSEFVKTTFIMSFSWHLEQVKDKLNRPLPLLLLMVHALSVIGLILLSGDLGVALIYVGIAALMLFCAGLSPLYFAGALGLAALGSPLIWTRLTTYQQKRILIGFNPDLDPYDKGWQAIMSRRAIANGGFFGKGLFSGTVHMHLAAAHTDFIFATICEKFGFVGGTVVFALEMLLLLRLIRLSLETKQDYGSFICIGAAAVIFTQTVENLGMCLAILPVVGITLPFVSYGGSSVLGIYFLFGIVHSVAAHRNARTVIRTGTHGLPPLLPFRRKKEKTPDQKETP